LQKVSGYWFLPSPGGVVPGLEPGTALFLFFLGSEVPGPVFDQLSPSPIAPHRRVPFNLGRSGNPVGLDLEFVLSHFLDFAMFKRPGKFLALSAKKSVQFVDPGV